MSFVAPESLSEQIAKYLAQRIIQGELSPGERIQEARVVNELNVSRGSVREALLILEKGYLINILPRRGAVVSNLSERDICNLYDLYVSLLTMLTGSVAERWQGQQLQPLLEQWHSMKALAVGPDKEAFVSAGFTLMHEAFAVCDNRYLADMLENLQPAVHRTYVLAVRRKPETIKEATVFFADIVNAVVKRDKDRIPGIVRAYGRYQCRLVLSALAQETAACA